MLPLRGRGANHLFADLGGQNLSKLLSGTVGGRSVPLACVPTVTGSGIYNALGGRIVLNTIGTTFDSDTSYTIRAWLIENQEIGNDRNTAAGINNVLAPHSRRHLVQPRPDRVSTGFRPDFNPGTSFFALFPRYRAHPGGMHRVNSTKEALGQLCTHTVLEKPTGTVTDDDVITSQRSNALALIAQGAGGIALLEEAHIPVARSCFKPGLQDSAVIPCSRHDFNLHLPLHKDPVDCDRVSLANAV
ncbi:hypothetical protein PG984_006531 [Apiospora sp. TS-2023a]